MAEWPGPATEFASYFTVQNKISWVRSDYSRYGKLIGQKMVIKEKKTYEKYKWIVCVSDYTNKQFCLIHLEHFTKTIAIKNPQNAKTITQSAASIDHHFNLQKKSINLISVGRIDSVKRFHEIPAIASKMKLENIDFRWFILGDGDSSEKARILQNIKIFNVENDVIYLGLKENPYSYIRDCDLFVCLSESEACPRVIDEAKILHTPSICTDFPSAHEFINNGENGIICTLEEISQNIITLLKNKKLYDKIKNNIKLFDFENENILDKINHIL